MWLELISSMKGCELAGIPRYRQNGQVIREREPKGEGSRKHNSCQAAETRIFNYSEEGVGVESPLGS